MVGKIYGIGVGPGDPELLTIKAIKKIQECEVIGIPAKDKNSCTAYQIVKKAIPEIEEKRIVGVDVPMTTNEEDLKKAYDAGSKKLMKYLDQKKSIAFLNLGDPTIYATYMEIHRRMIEAGYEAELVSGVPSFCAVAATLGISIAAQKEEIHILPGRYHGKEFEKYSGTKIIMKSSKKVKEIKDSLVRLENDNKIKAYAVTNCGMDDEVVCLDMKDLKEDAGYFTTILVKEK